MKHPVLSKSLAATIGFTTLGLLGACESAPLGEAVQGIESSNAMSENRLSYNRLSYNQMSSNRMSYNRMSYNRLSYNSLDNDVHETEEGREVLRYIVRCAFEEGDSLVIESNGTTYEFPGLLGLAPEWEHRPLRENEERRISGCLIAHVNAFGTSVPISLRYPYYLSASEQEREAFPIYEGAFFGNLFAEEEAPLYSCYATPPPVSESTLNVSTGDRLLRLCTEDVCGPIESLGACDDICTLVLDGNHVSCNVPGSDLFDHYTNPVHVWLADPTSDHAVWGGHINMLESYYGVPYDPNAPTDEVGDHEDVGVGALGVVRIGLSF